MISRGLLYCVLCGLIFALVTHASFRFSPQLAWFWLEGFLMAAAFFPVVRWGPRKPLALFATIWLVLIFVGGVVLNVDTLIFTTFTFRQVVGFVLHNGLAQTVLAAALVLLAGPFRLRDVQREVALAPLSTVSASWRVAVGGLVYLVFYYVFGGIFYTLFTRPYYENPTPGLPVTVSMAAALGIWFPIIQFGRGVFLTLSSVPLARGLRASRGVTCVVLGAVLWVLGGLGPLLVTGDMLPGEMRFYHTVEILLQHGGLGIVLGLLLRPKPKAAA
jgi:hypothetical protein